MPLTIAVARSDQWTRDPPLCLHKGAGDLDIAPGWLGELIRPATEHNQVTVT